MSRQTRVFDRPTVVNVLGILSKELPVPAKTMTRYHISRNLGEILGFIAYEKPEMGDIGRPKGKFVLTTKGRSFLGRELRASEARRAFDKKAGRKSTQRLTAA